MLHITWTEIAEIIFALGLAWAVIRFIGGYLFARMLKQMFPVLPIGTMYIIAVERRSVDYIAFINNDRAKWGCGSTENAAIGDAIRTHASSIGIAVMVPQFDRT